MFAVDQFGNTPLHLCSKQGHDQCVSLLLAFPGTDQNIKNHVRRELFWKIHDAYFVVVFFRSRKWRVKLWKEEVSLI
jgi:ankyrin repeat protein